jgi:enterochelin esterase-like enzyme
VFSGKIDRLENFKSQYISSRNIDIWLPEGYNNSKKYSVLYMYDGQMLFDPEQTWNKQAWNIDDIASELIKKNKVKPFIILGIWSNPNSRHPDYFPQKPFENLTTTEKDTVYAQLKKSARINDLFKPQSDDYLKFLVHELKPFIDKKYSVYADQKNTCIAGSSMGGLISMYAICEYPDIFGSAICMSTHWLGTFTKENNPIPQSFIQYLSKSLPNPQNHKIYFDCGDQTLDAFYPETQMKVDLLMKKKKYGNPHWITRYFPGEDHSEKAWNKRVNIPLTYIFEK